MHIILTYRFLYGFRAVTPLVIGAGATRTRTFMLLSAVSTIVWAIVYCTTGYIFGEVIKSQLGHIEHIEKYIIAVLLLVGLSLMAVNLLRRRTETAV